jgi:hypothetical protein
MVGINVAEPPPAALPTAVGDLRSAFEGGRSFTVRRVTLRSSVAVHCNSGT